MHPERDVDSPPPRVSRGFLWFLAIAGAVLLFVSLVRHGNNEPIGMHHPGVGGRLESLQLEPLVNAEQPVSLDDLQGKVTLINFWGPWCPPCLQEMPDLLKLEKKYRGRDDVRFLLVAYPRGQSSDELRSDSSHLLQRLDADPPLYYEPDQKLVEEVMQATKLKGFGFPTTIVIDRTGRIRALWNYYNERFVDEMGQTIEQLLAEKAS